MMGGNDMKKGEKSWAQEKRAVVLTNLEWEILVNYLKETSKDREKLIDVYENLARLKEEDGSPVFPEGYTAVWKHRDIADTIDRIIGKLEV